MRAGTIGGGRRPRAGYHAPVNFERSTALTRRLHELIPGGAHTYAKGDDQYPEGMAPGHRARARRHVWDVDGNEFIEYGMGLRSVTLGHAYPPVVEAVARRSTAAELRPPGRRSSSRAAERFLDACRRAEMVKFAKNGSDVTTAAVKLARAATGRDLVAICRRPPVLLHRRLVHRHHADGRRHPAGHPAI